MEEHGIIIETKWRNFRNAPVESRTKFWVHTVNKSDQQYVYFPRTTPERYVSGYTALNLPSPEGTTGDWHPLGCFYAHPSDPNPIASIFGEGENAEKNTNNIFGTYGIYERSAWFLKNDIPFEGNNCYVANHCRAILDVIYYHLLRAPDLYSLRCISDEMLDTENQKGELFSKAEHMLALLPESRQTELKKWLNHEIYGHYALRK
jgi:hypothetical protein